MEVRLEADYQINTIEHETMKLSSINQLNNDILRRIFDFLNLDDKIRLQRTCSRWRSLLSEQLSQVKSLRIGLFHQGGYQVTSGLQVQNCEHQLSAPNQVQYTATLFDGQALSFPADLETQCFSIHQYDYLHRSIKHSQKTITCLTLGRLNITYRLLMVLAHNLPNLEHLELIACAGQIEDTSNRKQQRQGCVSILKDSNRAHSIESFNNSTLQRGAYNNGNCILSMILYNQHQDEQINMEERLLRASIIRNCDLVKLSKEQNYWPNLRHLLVKECNLLNEFSLSLILAITSKSLEHLVIESNQYLTGEFLNYCRPSMKTFKVKYCPLLQPKFLQDLEKIKTLVANS